ncbi:ABC transporter [Sinorhizobium kostiense]|nr:ABC transporter [Sinorhizobium kostiense]
MSRILVLTIALLSVVGLSACGTIGKGKGKAPPPVVAAEPVEPAPVFK